jgi:hypothetical protein
MLLLFLLVWETSIQFSKMTLGSLYITSL